MGTENGDNSEAINVIKVIFIPNKDPTKTISQSFNDLDLIFKVIQVTQVILSKPLRVARFVTI
jgi:hypothetical protein